MNGLPLLFVVVLALVVTALVARIRRITVSAPLVLVVVGLGLSYVPGLPEVPLDPNFVLYLVLPPLLYSAALESSALRIRENLRPIGLLAVGLVVFTTAAVGMVAWLLVPDLPLASALVLGAVVAPPDAVAAASIGRSLGMQRRAMAILEGESLLNDATSLTLFRVLVAVAAPALGGVAVSAGSTVLEGLGEFALAAVGGTLFGAVAGWVIHRVRLRLGDAVMESAVGLVVPFGIYVLAEEIYTSGVLAVVVAGLYLGHKSTEGGFATRLQDQAVWKALDTVLEALVFALIGLQLAVVVRGLALDTTLVVIASVAVLGVTIAARFAWIFPTVYLTRLVRTVRSHDPPPNWRIPVVLSWAGMRGVVTLAAAFAIPETMRGRDIVVFLAFVVTVGTLLLQGTTLPTVIRRLRVLDTGAQDDALSEAAAKQAAAEAALSRLRELADDDERPVPEHVTEQLRGWAEQRSNGAWERLGRPAAEIGEAPSVVFTRVRRAMLDAERDTFVRFRDMGRIDDSVLREMLRELDYEEAMLDRT